MQEDIDLRFYTRKGDLIPVKDEDLDPKTVTFFKKIRNINKERFGTVYPDEPPTKLP